MQLLSSGASPFVRKVRVQILETGQDDIEIRDVAASPMGGEEALNAANPVGKIPALVRDEGPTLYDSRVITRYLDARAEAGMYPEARLWDTLTLEATGDEIMVASVGMTYEMRFRGEVDLVWQDWLDNQWAKIDRALDALNARWMSHLHGPLDMGQISVACALGYLDLRHDARGWRDGRDALAAWEKGFAQRAAMQATKPE